MATKSVVVRVRCSEGEKAAWEGKAAVIGVSLSEWVRGQLNRVGEVPPESRGFEVSSEVAAPLIEEGKAAVERLRGLEQPRSASYSERFVVPVSCPAPSKKTFRPDFK